ncbi:MULTISPECIES: hypothetical protein [Sphingobacterium]|uniref:Uncharacterized protein n=1 Tax=Sphingobacterium cellulitidis TaxID=1768011 RepID=A0A8H9FYG8_9SPHI|nr:MULTISPECIES: hypothetical protein [Sphingobacterium]MBA8985763.1 hypothetical protein [Sphingobacterium soli]WFB64174.1 hypothetical protein PZ892_02960 [Sphingobacterium sp. WM]GGE07124.1 hypothetical protein GCM10011516_01040 [Sphingobacterium soli]
MRYLFNYIYHFLISNSRHGTHSPFVYALAEKVIYNPTFKSKNFVEFPEGFKVKYYSKLKNILSFWEIEKLTDDLKENDSEAYWVKNIQDQEELISLIDSGKILIIHEPYKQIKKWKTLISNEEVTVSINLFHFGILLKREAQRKEDFLLRYLN